MNYPSTSHRTPMRDLRPKKSKKRNTAAYTPIPPMPMPRSISNASTTTTTTSSSPQPQHTIKKPMRPLTAYHIFFQIEREYLIQSMAGPDADKTMHDNKSYFPGAPRRYRYTTKLLPDWYAGPGKRQKRKHRKSHGKIGFLELSRVISKRWAVLGSADPETKQFVSRIAAKELGEYKLEMKQYKALLLSASDPATPTSTETETVVSAAAAAAAVGAMISPSSSPSPSTFFAGEVSSSSSSSSRAPPMMPCLSQPMMQFMPVENVPDPILSLDQAFDEDEIDYSICSKDNDGHYIPSPSPASTWSKSNMNMINLDGSICDPLFELDNEQPIAINKRCVSPVTSSGMNVNLFSDDEIYKMLEC